MVNPTFVADAQKRITKTACPMCGRPSLEFSLRCDLGSAECLFMARCQCGAAFDIDADSFPAGLTAESLRDGNIACPTCDDHLAIVTLTCSVSSCRCRYGLKCPSCGTDD